MIIFALDLATETGCCDGELGAGDPRLWTWLLTDGGHTIGARLAKLRRFLELYFIKHPCDAVVYEAPLPISAMSKMGTSEETQTMLRGAVGILLAACHCYKKPVTGVQVQDARGSVLGWRRNTGSGVLVEKKGRLPRDEDTKERVMREVRLFGVNPENDNEADAWVVWRWACNKENPRLAISSTPLFRDYGRN